MLLRSLPLTAALLLLAACGRPEGEAAPAAAEGQQPDAPRLVASPESEGAKWSVSADGLGIHFGREPDKPYLTLACTVSPEQPPRLTVIRHARSDPGATALFAVLGNGIAARFRADAVLAREEGWRWEATLPAAAGEFDVFTGPRAIEATLPGAGMLHLPPGGLPREFVSWCRRNGANTPAEKEISPLPQD